jgi:hypothetical protein
MYVPDYIAEKRPNERLNKKALSSPPIPLYAPALFLANWFFSLKKARLLLRDT